MKFPTKAQLRRARSRSSPGSAGDASYGGALLSTSPSAVLLCPEDTCDATSLAARSSAHVDDDEAQNPCIDSVVGGDADEGPVAPPSTQSRRGGVFGYDLALVDDDEAQNPGIDSVVGGDADEVAVAPPSTLSRRGGVPGYDLTPEVLDWLQSGVQLADPGAPRGGGRRGPRCVERARRDRVVRRVRERDPFHVSAMALRAARVASRRPTTPPASGGSPRPRVPRALLRLRRASTLGAAASSQRSCGNRRGRAPTGEFSSLSEICRPGTPSPPALAWSGIDGRFARRVRRSRNAIFSLAEARACQASSRRRSARNCLPRPVLYGSRRDHNRRMHALNGNGAVPEARALDVAGLPALSSSGANPLPDTSAPGRVARLCLLGMRDVGENTDLFSRVVLACLGGAHASRIVEHPQMVPSQGSEAPTLLRIHSWALAPFGRPLDIIDDSVALAVLDMAVLPRRVEHAVSKLRLLLQRRIPTLVFCGHAGPPLSTNRRIANSIVLELCHLGALCTLRDEGVPPWASVRQALCSAANASPAPIYWLCRFGLQDRRQHPGLTPADDLTEDRPASRAAMLLPSLTEPPLLSIPPAA